MTFKIGDKVTWASQSQGAWKLKTGEVVAVIPKGVRPSVIDFPSLYSGWSGPGIGRSEESYVVLVGKKLYWPHAKKLSPLP